MTHEWLYAPTGDWAAVTVVADTELGEVMAFCWVDIIAPWQSFCTLSAELLHHAAADMPGHFLCLGCWRSLGMEAAVIALAVPKSHHWLL